MGFSQADSSSDGTTTVSNNSGVIASIDGPIFKGYDEDGNKLYTVVVVYASGATSSFQIDEDEVLYWVTLRNKLRAQSYQTDLDVRDAEVHDSPTRPYTPPPDRSAEEPLFVDPPIPVLLLDLPEAMVIPLGERIQLTFTPTACNIQWYEVGVGALPGKTRNSLTLDYMLAEDAGRQFYAICWTDTQPDDGVLTRTTSLVVGPEVYDPYRNLSTTYQMEAYYDTGDWFRSGETLKFPIHPAELTGSLYASDGAYKAYVPDNFSPPDNFQDWSHTQWISNNARFGTQSLRHNGIRDYINFYGIDYGINSQHWYDPWENANFSNPQGWDTPPEEHQGGAPPLFDQDFTFEGWFFSDYAINTLEEIDAASGQMSNWYNAYFNAANRATLFSIGRTYNTETILPQYVATSVGTVNRKRGAVDPSTGYGRTGALFSMPEGNLVWSSFYPNTELYPRWYELTQPDFWLEHRVIVADLEPHNVRDGAWHFVSVTRRSGNIYIHVDGVLVGSGFDDTSYPATLYNAYTNSDHGPQAFTPFQVGQIKDPDAGWLDAFVFTYRWTSRHGYYDDASIFGGYGTAIPNIYSPVPWAGDIDSFRYTPTKARYTAANYSVPVTPFHSQAIAVYGGEARVPSPLVAPAVQAQVETGFASAFVPVVGSPQVLSTSDTTVHGLLVPSPLSAPAAFTEVPVNVYSNLSVPAPLFAPEGEVAIPLSGRVRVRSPLGQPRVVAAGQFDVKIDVRSALGAPSAAVVGPIDSWMYSRSPLSAPAVQASVSATVTVQETVYETAVITSAMYTDLVRATVTDSAVITSAATIEASSKLLESAAIASAAYPRQTIVVSYTDVANINDRVITDVRTIQLVTESAVVSDIATLRAPRATVTESAVISSALYAGRTHTVAVSDAAKIVARAYTPVRLTAVDGAVITDATYFQITARVTTTDAAVITSTAYAEAEAVTTVTESAVITANALPRVQAKVTTTDEAFIYDTAYPVAALSGQPFDEQNVWTANTNIWAMTRYATNDITGLAGRYAVAASGLYEQASTYANLSIQSGFLNFGSPSLKATPAMYSYSTHASPMTISVTADLNGAQNTYTYTEMARPAGDHRAVRTLFGKGLKSTYFKLGISSSGYTHVQYCVPVVQELSRRI